MAQTSPPKPWQIRQTQGSASNSTLRVSSAVANGRSIPDTTGNTDLNTPGTASSSLAPPIPSRPGATSTLSRYGGVDSYNRYGSYGSGYGGYGGYGSYGSYGSMNSGYGGYGSRYGSYGSSYGGYGSSYGGYGSSYGGYGSYGRFGGMNGPMMGQNNNQSYFQGAFNQISKFGQIAESFSMFSRLLDANFDAMHGSFASVARLLEVFGEFLYVVQTFAVFRYTGRLVNWMLGKNTTSLKRIGGSGKEAAVISMDDFKRFENRGKSKFFPLVFVLLGFTVIGIPMFLSRIWKRMKGENLDSIWNEEPDPNQPQISRALFDFNGSAPEELSFRQNDIIKVLGKPFPDWWEGEINGRRGLFPCNYVEVMENPEQQPVDPNKKPVS